MTATLLIAVFMISAFAVAIPVSAQTIWHVPGDFDTIQEAVDSDTVIDGDTILVGSGKWFGAVVTKSVEIKGKGGAVIVDGPAHPYYTHLHFGFKIYSVDGGTISHFTFEGGEIGDTGNFLAFPVFAFDSNDVTIEHNTIYDALQGITVWQGNNWVIKHNVIEGLWHDHGGGIGMMIGTLYPGGLATGNLIANNKITASFTDTEPDGKPRTYSCGGISLLADERWGYTADELSDNKIVHNKVTITGPDTSAISLEHLIYPLTVPDPDRAKQLIHDNLVGFNDFRGSVIGLFLYPGELDEVNDISRNLGENRAYDGLPASDFKPV